MSLTRQSILESDDRKPQPVEIAEWGGFVSVRPMSVAALKAIQKARVEGDDADLLLLVKCVCDDKGVLLFTEEDIPALREKHYAVLDKLIPACFAVNKLNDDSLKKSLETTQT